MKLTDFALIFAAVFLPMVVLVYVNTAFVVKSEKQEMYYKNLMNSAISDAVSSMKHIENEDLDIDYGYSGIVDKKVSINAKTAVNTFYNSLANNFNIVNNDISIERLKMYIPAIAILDYDGIYIHSAEQDESGNISFITKPKVYYSYSYVIKTDKIYDILPQDCQIVPINELEESNIINERLLENYIYEVKFTMDDYIELNIYEFSQENKKITDVIYSKGFYITDENNNEMLVNTEKMLKKDKDELKALVISHLQSVKQRVIGEIGMREISYAVNKHNIYAKQTGITYKFNFSVESDTAWFETMDGIGMIAIIQGVSLGNRYLNYKAYSASDLIISKKYYVSKGVLGKDDLSYLERDLYHASENCTAYLQYKNSTEDKLIPSYYSSRADAATQGYYPCPICKP